ncbi:hypothetical protein ACROYT_G001413 [Oculina patagonica]
MLNYYHRFLPDVVTVLEPLHQLLRKGSKWQWLKEQQEAFEKAKELLQSAELLVHFDPSKELILATDASDYGVGAVLSHKVKGGAEQPIGYMSRSLNTAERNYSTLEKEALAIIFGIKKFNQFLCGHPFTIKTDHKPLEGILNEKKGIPALAAPESSNGRLPCLLTTTEPLHKARQEFHLLSYSWMSGTIVEKTSPVSTRVQLDDRTVIRRHQDHVRRHEVVVVEEPVAGDTPSVTPIALPDLHITSPDPVVSHQPDVPKAPPATPTQTPVELSPLRTHPVRKRVRPGYLKDYLC